MAGSVSTISRVTLCGISMAMATPLWKASMRPAFLQIFLLVADHILGHLILLVVVGVHEVEALGIPVKVGVFLVFDLGALDLLGGPLALRDLHPVGNPAHIDLGDGRPLAGMNFSALRTT